MSSIYVFSYFRFGFEGRIWDLIVSVPDHYLSFYSSSQTKNDENIGVLQVDEPSNKLQERKLPVGSSHGFGTAESVAKLYGILANGGMYNGRQVLTVDTIRALEKTAKSGLDQMVGIRLQRGMGTWPLPVVANNGSEKVFEDTVSNIHILIQR